MNKNTKMPEVLWIKAFKYLTIQDFLSTRLVSRTLKTYADSCPEIYERECVTRFTSDMAAFEYVCAHRRIEDESLELFDSRGTRTQLGLSYGKWHRLAQRGGELVGLWSRLGVPMCFGQAKSGAEMKRVGKFVFSMLKGSLE